MAFQAKDYAGWNLEALQCAVIHEPMEDTKLYLSSLGQTNSEEESEAEGEEEEEVPLWS